MPVKKLEEQTEPNWQEFARILLIGLIRKCAAEGKLKCIKVEDVAKVKLI
ncbi:Uncharacterized [Moorella glycerini]|uniref:Uncharacterized protein n=1 Tax=Neomoorella stamsii TaxID=1266720 RepID=A0A9X7J1H0_9FIRM|nr:MULTISPECIES: hypothetical protein [Moorella]PRR69636.1 hypothetical protein MOST_30580 [Moorella stamsii]CEP67840.1 Uncharacterized [Moorella glycerini]